jgi:thiosulfate dehydrogenase
MTADKWCRALVAGVALLASTLMANSLAAQSAMTVPWSVPDIEKLPDDDQGRLARSGQELVMRTYSLIGPQVPDPAKRYAGNNLACRNCHLDEGTKKFGNPLWGLMDLFPRYDAETGQPISIEQRVNACMTRSMNGRPLPLDAPEMKAMVAYIAFLSSGVAPGVSLDGHGSGQMAELDRPADPARGEGIYRQTCAICHGTDGEGVRRNLASTDLGYVSPPLWGPDSFNDGAGMNRLTVMANFVHSNMPNGTSYDFPRLSTEDSWDVAAFVVSKPKPRKADLGKDYPDLLRKPADTPYGPYADGFSQEQHVYGPFGPIRKRLADLEAAKASKPAGNAP